MPLMIGLCQITSAVAEDSIIEAKVKGLQGQGQWVSSPRPKVIDFKDKVQVKIIQQQSYSCSTNTQKSQLKLSRKETYAGLRGVSWCCSSELRMILCHALPATADVSLDTCQLSPFPSKYRASMDVLQSGSHELHLLTVSALSALLYKSI